MKCTAKNLYREKKFDLSLIYYERALSFAEKNKNLLGVKIPDLKAKINNFNKNPVTKREWSKTKKAQKLFEKGKQNSNEKLLNKALNVLDDLIKDRDKKRLSDDVKALYDDLLCTKIDLLLSKAKSKKNQGFFLEAIEISKVALKKTGFIYSISHMKQKREIIKEFIDKTYTLQVSELLNEGNKNESRSSLENYEVAIEKYYDALNLAKKMSPCLAKTNLKEKIKSRIKNNLFCQTKILIQSAEAYKKDLETNKCLRTLNRALKKIKKISQSPKKKGLEKKIKVKFDRIVLSQTENIVQKAKTLRDKSEYEESINKFQKSLNDIQKMYNNNLQIEKKEKIQKYIEETKIAKVKEKILTLGTNFGRLHVKEIAEECEENKSLIVKTIKKMIQKNEINAKYFRSSKAIVFNQQANIDEIDELMNKYSEWEKSNKNKKNH